MTATRRILAALSALAVTAATGLVGAGAGAAAATRLTTTPRRATVPRDGGFGGFARVQFAVPPEAEPIVADFNGDGRADVLWYGPGTAFDQLTLAAPGRTFTRHSLVINGVYQPLEGDFNGDHHADILWYGPGRASDYIWYGHGDGTFSSYSIVVNGVYKPVVGDFNGDHRDDVLWYAPGAAPDYVSYGLASGFQTHSVAINGTYDYVTGGDFNGDGRTDILFWSSRLPSSPVWLGTSTVGFTSTTFPSPGTGAYPMVMKVDGDAKSDILWYGAGNIPDALALGATGDTHLTALSIHGDYQPLWGNFDGDANHYSDVLWWSRAPGGVDAFWEGIGGGFEGVPYTTAHVDWSSHDATFGDFDGDGALDICFYDASGRNTFFYFG